MQKSSGDNTLFNNLNIYPCITRPGSGGISGGGLQQPTLQQLGDFNAELVDPAAQRYCVSFNYHVADLRKYLGQSIDPSNVDCFEVVLVTTVWTWNDQTNQTNVNESNIVAKCQVRNSAADAIPFDGAGVAMAHLSAENDATRVWSLVVRAMGLDRTKPSNPVPFVRDVGYSIVQIFSSEGRDDPSNPVPM